MESEDRILKKEDIIQSDYKEGYIVDLVEMDSSYMLVVGVEGTLFKKELSKPFKNNRRWRRLLNKSDIDKEEFLCSPGDYDVRLFFVTPPPDEDRFIFCVEEIYS